MVKMALITLGAVVGLMVLVATVGSVSGLAGQQQERQPSKAVVIWSTLGIIAIVLLVAFVKLYPRIFED